VQWALLNEIRTVAGWSLFKKGRKFDPKSNVCKFFLVLLWPTPQSNLSKIHFISKPCLVSFFLLFDGQLHRLEVRPDVVGALLDLAHRVVQLLKQD
jgi:hypothetical protein